MGNYIIKRLFHSLLVLIGITFIVFFLLYLSGNPVRLLMPPDATVEQLKAAQKELGFDDPFFVQYSRFLGKVVRLDFGKSLRRQLPVFEVIKPYFLNTLLLTTASFIIALVIAIPAGIFSAIKRDSIFDFLISIGVLIGQATPIFWLGIGFILVFSVRLGWFPTGGFGYTKNLVLPAFTLAIFSTSRIARMSRSSMLEVLGEDYIRTARAQGIRELLINFKYAFKNAAIPIVTLVGVEYCILLEGAVLTEIIFSWPGVGRLVINSVYDRDYPVVQAIVILATTIIVFANLGIDVLYTYLDPRIRYGKTTK